MWCFIHFSYYHVYIFSVLTTNSGLVPLRADIKNYPRILSPLTCYHVVLFSLLRLKGIHLYLLFCSLFSFPPSFSPFCCCLTFFFFILSINIIKKISPLSFLRRIFYLLILFTTFLGDIFFIKKATIFSVVQRSYVSFFLDFLLHPHRIS